MKRAAVVLSNFYKRSLPVGFSPRVYIKKLINDVHFYFEELWNFKSYFNEKKLTELRDQHLKFIDYQGLLLGNRASKVMEAHGDLRPEHVCLNDNPVIIDCLEFDRQLRLLDPIQDIALLSLKCELRGFPKIGNVFFETYHEITDDEVFSSLKNFYKSITAMIRAMLSIRHITEDRYKDDPQWVERANLYIEAANSCCFSS